MFFEDFENLLWKKYQSGIHVFTGMKTRNIYTIQNSGSKRTGWSLFIKPRDKAEYCRRSGTNFFSCTSDIWDLEH